MNVENNILQLISNNAFQQSVREGKPLDSFYAVYNKQIIQEAIIIIQLLDNQKIITSEMTIKHNYQTLLNTILFK